MCSGRGAVRLARTVRVGEVGGSNPLAPTNEKVALPLFYFKRMPTFGCHSLRWDYYND